MIELRRQPGECPGGEWSGVRAPELVSRLGGPDFVDMRPGHVQATCAGLTGAGPDRTSAFRALADQVRAMVGS
jgi:hypothetical protein